MHGSPSAGFRKGYLTNLYVGYIKYFELCPAGPMSQHVSMHVHVDDHSEGQSS